MQPLYICIFQYFSIIDIALIVLRLSTFIWPFQLSGYTKVGTNAPMKYLSPIDIMIMCKPGWRLPICNFFTQYEQNIFFRYFFSTRFLYGNVFCMASSAVNQCFCRISTLESVPFQRRVCFALKSWRPVQSAGCCRAMTYWALCSPVVTTWARRQERPPLESPPTGRLVGRGQCPGTLHNTGLKNQQRKHSSKCILLKWTYITRIRVPGIYFKRFY